MVVHFQPVSRSMSRVLRADFLRMSIICAKLDIFASNMIKKFFALNLTMRELKTEILSVISMFALLVVFGNRR